MAFSRRLGTFGSVSPISVRAGKRYDATIALSNSALSRSHLLTFLLYGALVGALYVTPFYLIQVRHYAPAKAGAVFLPLIALMFIFSTRVGALIPWIGERVLLAMGATLAGAGFVAFALSDGLNGYARAYFARSAPSWRRNDLRGRASHERRHVFGARELYRNRVSCEQRTLSTWRTHIRIPALAHSGTWICGDSKCPS